MKTKNYLAALGVAAGLMAPAVGSATDLNYNYIEFGYALKADFNGIDGDGLRLRGSIEVAPNIIVVGDLAKFDFDNNADLDLMNAGAGYIMRLNQQIDILGTVEVGRAKAKGPGGSASDTGFRLGGGVRAMVAPQIEAFGRIVYENYEGSDVYLEGGAFYHLNSQFSVGGTAQLGGDLDSISLVGRFSF